MEGKRIRRIVICLVLSVFLHVLVCSCFSLVLPSCNARSSFSLGSTWQIQPPEVERASAVAAFIKTLAIFRQWERRENYYGSGTTVIRICICAGGEGDTYAISFYVGHGNKAWYRNGIHYYIRDNNGDRTYDFVLYSYTSGRRTRLALIWSCFQAEQIGDFYDGTSYGPHGMPLAWMHTASLSPDGYSYPDTRGYAFIGWTKEAPYLIRTIAEAGEAGYNFLLSFYTSALYDQTTLNYALDYASYMVWGAWGIYSFWASPFHQGIELESGVSNMVLYGDGGLVLP